MRIFGFLLFLLPTVSFGAGNEFMVAAQLLSAAKNADIQQVQILINNGANATRCHRHQLSNDNHFKVLNHTPFPQLNLVKLADFLPIVSTL